MKSLNGKKKGNDLLKDGHIFKGTDKEKSADRTDQIFRGKKGKKAGTFLVI